MPSGALYICTEDVFPNKRLMQMVHNFSRRNEDNPVLKHIQFTDRIFIEHAGDLVMCEYIFVAVADPDGVSHAYVWD